MRMTLLAAALLSGTAATLAFYPPEPAPPSPPPSAPPAQMPPVIAPVPVEKPVIELVFVLDTTGSMGGLIDAAKEKIWSIASTMAQADPAPEIRIGLVGFRDRGDAYVTRVTDLSSDLDTMYGTLMDFVADGGGDTPESVNRALHDAVHRISWSQDPDTYRVVFLVGDAPPHMDYQDESQYPAIVAAARAKGIVVNTIQCGRYQGTVVPWTRIASLGHGQYFEVDQAGSAIAIATPYDARLAELAAELDGTRLYYGDHEAREKQAQKLAATEKLHAAASVAAQARRAKFNAAPSGSASFLGKGELVDDVSSGRVDLADIEDEKLPEPVRALAPEQRAALVRDNAERRAELKSQIKELAAERDSFLRDKVEASGDADASLDHQIYDAIKEQAEAAGIRYEAEAPSY